MKPDRPDLSGIPPEVLEYIQALEAELEGLRHASGGNSYRMVRTLSEIGNNKEIEKHTETEPPEPPSTLCVITATATGIVKRSPRHLYSRQNRGGMGIFDLDSSEEEPPAILAVVDQNQTVLAITNSGRAFRLPINSIPDAPVRSRGVSIFSKLNLSEDDLLTTIVPVEAQGYLALASQSGMVRLLRHHVFGEYMKPGISLCDYRSFGPLVSVCWTTGAQDLFLATRQGRAIRFSEKLVPPQSIQAIRLTEKDDVVSITAVNSDSGVFLLGADGKGTIRTMEGFAANKSPGAGGKVAMVTDRLICALSINEKKEVFIISHLGKIIRFYLDQIPAKEGAVQGVVCISLRADQPVTAILT